ncbi:MAG TPA: tetratricopeptide repeat protein [Longimicrobiales bacterium]|nr:tetratricopeptide repeat protein [Longimicrobiales bacterium]
MKNTAADIQRWSEEVARDPRSLAFLPLARAYRRQGLRDAAMQLCLRGLQAYPSHAEAHGLLAMLYLDAGDHERAADEWSMVLRVDADNFDALRGIGFCYLEQDRLSRARQSLERAALIRPSDPTVQEALRVLGTRQDLVAGGISGPATAGADDPWSGEAGPFSAAHVPSPTAPEAQPAADDTRGSGMTFTFEPVPEDSAAEPDAVPPAEPEQAPGGTGRTDDASAQHGTGVTGDPTRLFDEMMRDGPLLGALMVDAHGLVLAGRLAGGNAGDAELVGAVLCSAVDEAVRTVQHLGLGAWEGMLVETDEALLHIAPVAEGAAVVLAARLRTPPGWLLRLASQAADRAAAWVEAYA